MIRITGQLVDIFKEEIYPAEVTIGDGVIQSVTSLPEAPAQYILPGFIDAHVHIESSLLIPSEFARLAVMHGTIATVSDPHEIANVCGLPGVEFMIKNGKTVPFYFNFGAPSCVPATSFETAGATLGIHQVKELLQNPEIKYLSEMMNFPGVAGNDPKMVAEIAATQDARLTVGGHYASPHLGREFHAYAAGGPADDHEGTTVEDAIARVRQTA